MAFKPRTHPSVTRFVEQSCELVHTKVTTPKDDLRAAYTRLHPEAPLSDQEFSVCLMSAFPEVTSARVRVGGGQRAKVFRGIQLGWWDEADY